jgi:hypothetical protein
VPQVGLVGAQVLFVEAMPNTDKARLARSSPHLGHLASLSHSTMLRRSSNFSPHLAHWYS